MAYLAQATTWTLPEQARVAVAAEIIKERALEPIRWRRELVTSMISALGAGIGLALGGAIAAGIIARAGR